MTTVQTIRHSQVWVWAKICILALLLVVTVLARVAGADPRDPPKEPTTTYIVSPTGGTFVAGSYHTIRADWQQRGTRHGRWKRGGLGKAASDLLDGAWDDSRSIRHR